MFFYVFLTGYIVTGWLALEGKVPTWVPLSLLAVVPGFHIAGIIFYPTCIFLMVPWFRVHRKYISIAIAGAVGVAAAVVIYLGPSWVMTRIGDALRNDFLPLTTPPGGMPYGIFSTAHLLDFGNAYVHISPLSVAVIVLGLAFLPRRDYASSPAFQFLCASTVVGLGFMFVILPGLGMARDWDMISNFFIPLRFLTVYFLILFLRNKELRHAVLVIAVLGLLRLVGMDRDQRRRGAPHRTGRDADCPRTERHVPENLL